MARVTKAKVTKPKVTKPEAPKAKKERKALLSDKCPLDCWWKGAINAHDKALHAWREHGGDKPPMLPCEYECGAEFLSPSTRSKHRAKCPKQSGALEYRCTFCTFEHKTDRADNLERHEEEDCKSHKWLKENWVSLLCSHSTVSTNCLQAPEDIPFSRRSLRLLGMLGDEEEVVEEFVEDDDEEDDWDF